VLLEMKKGKRKEKFVAMATATSHPLPSKFLPKKKG
jgi:hypothetical protein